MGDPGAVVRQILSAPSGYLPPDRIGSRSSPACRALAEDCLSRSGLKGDELVGHLRAADRPLPAGKPVADRNVVASAGGMIVLGKVTALPAGDILRRPANFFDLEGKTVTFTPDGEGRYAVQTGWLTWVETGAATSPGEISLPFAFPFAGRTWTRVHANNNGNVSFTAPETTHWAEREPWSSGTMRSVAAAERFRRLVAVVVE